MPQGDGTGPRGNGPRTGRGLGPCPPQNNEDLNNSPQIRGGFGRGRGFGGGRGGGRGRRWCW